MRPVGRIRVAITIVALLLVAAPAAAQRPSQGAIHVAVNPFVGVFVFDDGELVDAQGLEVDAGPLLGGRLSVAIGEDWRLDGAYGWASGTVEASEFVEDPQSAIETDLGIHLLYGAVGFLISDEDVATELLLSAGAGLVHVDPEIGESDSDFMVTLGAGFTHPVNNWITFRGEARDHIAFCAAAERVEEFSPCVEDEALHHLEFSGGLEFWVW